MSSTVYRLRFDALPPARAGHLASAGVVGSEDAESTECDPLESTFRSADMPRARLEDLAATHFDPIWRLLRRLGVPSAAVEDAAQEVFTVAARRIGEVRCESERSFLYGTALRVAKSTRRRLGLERVRHEALDEVELAASGNPEALLTERRALVAVDLRAARCGLAQLKSANWIRSHLHRHQAVGGNPCGFEP